MADSESRCFPVDNSSKRILLNFLSGPCPKNPSQRSLRLRSPQSTSSYDDCLWFDRPNVGNLNFRFRAQSVFKIRWVVGTQRMNSNFTLQSSTIQAHDLRFTAQRRISNSNASNDFAKLLANDEIDSYLVPNEGTLFKGAIALGKRSPRQGRVLENFKWTSLIKISLWPRLNFTSCLWTWADYSVSSHWLVLDE